MATKNYQINQLQTDGSLLILHPETNADVINETTSKKVMTADERTKLNGIATGAQVNKIETIKVNGTVVNPDSNKVVNITVDASGAASSAVSAHNTSSTAHSDIRTLVSNAQTAANNAQAKANSAYTLAEGRARAVSFDTVEAMTSALKAAAKTDYKIGDNLFIKATGVPDYWISNVLTTNTGTYGYFEVSVLETQKVDLTNYYTKSEIDTKFLTKTDASGTYATISTVNTLSTTVSGHTTKISALETNVSNIQSKNTSQDTEITNIKNGTTTVGKATSATKLATARTISLTGDAAGSASFDGSTDKSISVTLASVGKAGTYSVVTTDAKGRVTSGAQVIEVGTTGQTSPSASLAIGGIFFKEI